MVKRNPPRNRRMPGIELFMECAEDALSPSQIKAQQAARYLYDQAIAKIRDAQAKAKIGKATIINKVDNVGKVTPQFPTKSTPPKVSPPNQKDPDRSSSPDIIFVGETPPSKPKMVIAQNNPQPRSLVVTTRSPIVTVPQQQSVSQQVYQLVTVNQGNPTQWIMKPVANVLPQQKTTNSGDANQGQPVSGTMGMGFKRPQSQDDQTSRKKLKKSNENESVLRRLSESDESGNWVPLDEYYYGKMEGDPTYEEEKGEFRFKCWYCNKMLYNNVKAMMHIQGHIDSSKQQNIDLSDLTQCKHCYKQFDTPFEMQTHVDKVHMSNTNVLLCRICDRDHESRSALTSHMRAHHNSCEMPYTCQLCKFRSSMYSDVVDHFKKKHDSSQHLLCLYCLRVFVVKFVSQGWGTTQTYYGHLMKHQSKAHNKKCGVCRLSFFNSQEVKAHKQKHHGPNQKAVLGTGAHSSKPDQVLIKVPSQNNVKSLNAPAVSKVLDFGGTTFPGEVHYHNCFECKMSMGTHDHYRKYVECSMCRFATNCSIAYANHMMGFHSGQMSSLNLNIPWERKMSKPMYCLCGFSSRYGNKIANHLVFCMKISCYVNKPEGGYEGHREEEESDPRHKPGASLLDALGLVKRRTVTPMYRKSEVIKEVEKTSPTLRSEHHEDRDENSKKSEEESKGMDIDYVSITEPVATGSTEKGDNLETDDILDENKLLEEEVNDDNSNINSVENEVENLDCSAEENLLKEENEMDNTDKLKYEDDSIVNEVEKINEDKNTDEIDTNTDEIDKDTEEIDTNTDQKDNKTTDQSDDLIKEDKSENSYECDVQCKGVEISSDNEADVQTVDEELKENELNPHVDETDKKSSELNDEILEIPEAEKIESAVEKIESFENKKDEPEPNQTCSDDMVDDVKDNTEVKDKSCDEDVKNISNNDIKKHSGVHKGDNSAKGEHFKTSPQKSEYREGDRDHHGSRSHYDDRKSHDRRHYSDRSYHHQGRQDDRNRYRRYDDRDSSYHDNRGYRDHSDHRDHHRDDRRHSNNRSQGYNQGHRDRGGYHGSYR